jgi:8-oxo-dGTP pyrophosphatase MutT (NUDIX family)/phosphohistidine phosphatase SixA
MGRRDEAADGRVAALVRAAGGVVWRRSGAGPEVCLVHRPRYDDWSLPKGKLDAGEHPLAAAVREVEEETAVRAAPQIRLSPARYSTRDGSPKTVDYWSMRVVGADEFRPNNEVDEVRWVTPAAATELASYPHDRQVLAEFAALPSITGLVLFIRHAYAGERDAWSAPDSVRPLDGTGHAQAATLAGLLALFRPTRLVSASPRRCLQTLAPLAKAVDLAVEVESVFDETAHEKDRAAAAARLPALAALSPVTVVCSQGQVIKQTMPLLTGESTVEHFATPKSTGWVLPYAADRLVAPDRLSEAPS